jgi:hypothetical protein
MEWISILMVETDFILQQLEFPFDFGATKARMQLGISKANGGNQCKIAEKQLEASWKMLSINISKI